MKKTLLFLTVIVIAFSAFSQKLPFQGKLIETGTPVNGTRTIEFSIGTLGWNETHADVQITDGLYFIVLGSINVLPDSLFYGIDEQQLDITVDGTSLSPVILFKPLTTPYEGRELNVMNDEGTIVGSMHAIADSTTKNGELVLSGTSGNQNVTIGAVGVTGDQGSIQIHDSIGTIKAMLWSADVNGRFRLFGENTGKLNMGFSKPWDPNGGETIRDLPSVSLEIDGLYYSNMYVIQNDTAIRGRSYLSSNVGEFNITRTDGHFLYKDNKMMSQYRFHDWGGTGYSGYFDLRGPNSRNIEMSSKHWVNADLPWFKMMGSQNQDVIQMSASEDSTESAYINLLSNDNKEASFYTTGLRFNTTGDEGRELISLNNEDRDGNGYAGYLNLSGPNSGNIHLGTRHWENPDIPLLNLYGSDGQNILELSAETDSIESGKIIINSKNGNSTYINSNGLNIFNSGENKSVDIGSRHIALRDDANQYHHLASMNTQNDNDNGWYGSFSLRGPSSQNIHIGSREWVNSNLPKLNLYGSNDGTNDFHAMELSVEPDGEGFEYGFINLHSQNGKSLHLSPGGLGVEKAGMETHTHANTDPNTNFGYLFTRGPNSTNFETGAQWENSDRAYLNMNGDTDENRLRFAIYEDGAQNEHGNIEIRSAANKKAVIEHDQITFWNTGDPNDWKDYIALRYEDDGQGNEQGTLHLNSKEEKTAYLSPRNIALRDDANGYRHLVSLSSQNDNNTGWAGNINVNGPTTSNIYIGHQQNPELPWITLQGTGGHEAMQIGAVDDITERGFIKMVNKDSGEEMFYSSHGVGGNTTFQIGNDVTVNGSVTATEHITTTSDKRFKKNIKTLDNSLEKINLIEGVSYNWRQDEFPEKNFSSDKQIGVIAQELEAQFPALVNTNNDGYKSVNYNGFTAVLLEAVKELNTKVEKLEAENMNLRAELSVSSENGSDIQQLKEQMEVLTRLVQIQNTISGNIAANEFGSTSGLK